MTALLILHSLFVRSLFSMVRQRPYLTQPTSWKRCIVCDGHNVLSQHHSMCYSVSNCMKPSLPTLPWLVERDSYVTGSFSWLVNHFMELEIIPSHIEIICVRELFGASSRNSFSMRYGIFHNAPSLVVWRLMRHVMFYLLYFWWCGNKEKKVVQVSQ